MTSRLGFDDAAVIEEDDLIDGAGNEDDSSGVFPTSGNEAIVESGDVEIGMNFGLGSSPEDEKLLLYLSKSLEPTLLNFAVANLIVLAITLRNTC